MFAVGCVKAYLTAFSLRNEAMSVKGMSDAVMKALYGLTNELQDEIGLKVVREVNQNAEDVLRMEMRRKGIVGSHVTGTINKQSKKVRNRTRRYKSVTEIKSIVRVMDDATLGYAGSDATAGYKVRFLESGVNPHYAWGRRNKYWDSIRAKRWISIASKISNAEAPSIAANVIQREIKKIPTKTINKTIGKK